MRDESAAVAPTELDAGILVLDHQAGSRDVVCRFLARHGFQPLEASTVAEAASVLNRTPVAAILLDVTPPKLGETSELLARLREEPVAADTPTVVMSGWVLNEQQQQVIRQQHGFLFHKPEGLTALIGFLKQVTQGFASPRRAH